MAIVQQPNNTLQPIPTCLDKTQKGAAPDLTISHDIRKKKKDTETVHQRKQGPKGKRVRTGFTEYINSFIDAYQVSHLSFSFTPL